MKYLKNFNENIFPYKHEITNDEFEKVFNYFCFDVFKKERRDKINKILAESIQYTEFLETKQRHIQNNMTLDEEAEEYKPYYGVASSLSSFGGLSYDFQKTVNDETYDMNVCKSWAHCFKDQINDISWRNSFGKMKHGYPYYGYSLNLIVTDSWNDKSIDNINILIKHNDQYNIITSYLKKCIIAVANTYNIDLDVSVVSYGDRHDRNTGSFLFKILLIDLDFEPKRNILD